MYIAIGGVGEGNKLSARGRELTTPTYRALYYRFPKGLSTRFSRVVSAKRGLAVAGKFPALLIRKVGIFKALLGPQNLAIKDLELIYVICNYYYAYSIP